MIRAWLTVLLLGLPCFLPAGELDDLLREVQDARAQERRIDDERSARFLADKNQQQKLLNDTRAALAKAEAESKELRGRFAANEARLQELGSALKKESGELGVLFGAVREFAGVLRSDVENSLVSAEFPRRAEKLEALSKSKEIPRIAQLEELWLDVLKEIAETGKTVRFHGRVTDSAGNQRDTDVVRIGPFTALADGKYLRYASETGQLVEFPRQPPREYLALAKKLNTDQDGDDLVEVAVDPTRGVVLDLSMQMPDTLERIDQGGVIGYLIIALGIAGAIMVLTRLWTLHRTGQKIKAQLGDLTRPNEDNPLGRVLAATADCPPGDVEKLELQLDEAVLRELPTLERGLSLVKLLIAVAPLLGLLGTVTGMIQVFQSITQYGSGDPRLMAGGIAEALVTTMLGLEVAIPLSFLYSLLSARSRSLVQVLDEQSAGLLSQNLERGRP